MADTIFALSSGAPPAAIAIIRLSGPRARDVVERLSARPAPPPRRLALRTLRDAQGDVLDRALVTWSPAPATATGEDTAELHLHGGRAVVAAVIAALAAVPGLRQAEPGEFTRRAFDNGHIDLADAEALADLIVAETEQQRRIAIGRLDGRFGLRMEAWRTRLLAIAAQVEAAIEFGEDDPLAVATAPLPHPAIASLADEIGDALRAPPVERLRDGVRVAIAGPPNAGKSTLLNALVGRPAAIVSSIEGTTRDRIEAPVAIAGIPFLLIDSAGLRATADPVERAGVSLAKQALVEADIVLWLGTPHGSPTRPNVIRLAAKSDVQHAAPGSDISVSAVTGDGLAALQHRLLAVAKDLLPSEGSLAFNGRQRSALKAALAALGDASQCHDEPLLGHLLQQAAAAFDRAIGRTETEDMLDALFGSLCIGK